MADRYYVGGNGSKWDLTSSWATSSGGTPGASVPTSADNIFFDSNSGLQSASNITYNTSSTLNCNNVTFSQAGLLAFGTGSLVLQIYGNAVFLNMTTPPLTTKFYGGSQTVQSNGASTVLYAYGSSLTLRDDLTAYVVLHYSGDLDFNGHNVTAPTIISSLSAPGHMYLRSGTITVTSAFSIMSSQTTLVPGTAVLRITGTLTLYAGVPALYSVVTTGSVAFPTVSCTFTSLQLARGYNYTFAAGVTYGIANPIVQAGNGTTTIGLISGSTNFVWASNVQQVLSNATINACTAIGAGHPFLAIGSSKLTKPPSATACVGWIGPQAIGFTGD